MHSRISSIVLPFLAIAATAMPARAATFTAASFSITFPNGWTEGLGAPAGTGESTLVVMNPTSGAICIMSTTVTDHPVTSQELAAMVEAYAGDSVTKVSDGSLTLGGKSFAYAEFMNVDTSMGNGRVRVYYTSSGNLLFTGAVVYQQGFGANPIPDVQSALATLSLQGTPIRAWAVRMRPAYGPANRDVMGRLSAPRAPTALYGIRVH